MSDTVVSRPGKSDLVRKGSKFLGDHLSIGVFVLLELASLAGGVAFDKMGQPILAGIMGAVAVLIPVTILAIFGFLQLLRVIAPYLRTVE